MMAQRKIHIMCVQETRWKGNKTKELGDGYKLIFSGANGRGNNGVGIIFDGDTKNKVTSVCRRSDRVMSVKLQLNEMELNIVSVCAPQVGCQNEEKDRFWRDVELEMLNIPSEERVFLGGDLNGYIGKGNNEITERKGGKWGVGEEYEEGKRIWPSLIPSLQNTKPNLTHINVKIEWPKFTS